MIYGPGTVFVLGAGFTKSFLPNAPLLEDDYGAREILEELQGREFQYAKVILQQELQTCGGININIERLMTRLDGRMPYDLGHRAAKQLDLLFSLVMQRFVRRIEAALVGLEDQPNELRSFARHCIANQINCITFNYDYLLDKALWGYPPVNYPNWSPDRGYGFPCRISEASVRDVPGPGEASLMLLLKLHGSINWRVPLGYTKPYPLEVVRHHENWFRHYNQSKLDLDVIEPVLEQDPVIIPPVLSKTALVEQPILSFLWSRAFDVLTAARHVVFIGYSLPVTDISAGYLFREGLRHLDQRQQITVVDYAKNDEQRLDRLQALRPAYRKVFPEIGDGQFNLAGGRSWVFNNLSRWLYDTSGKPIAFLFGDHVISRHGRFFGTSDSGLVWGDSDGEKSRYKGQIEADRLLFNEAGKADLKYQNMEAPPLPGVPTFVPDPIGPYTPRPGFRGVETD